MLQIRELSKSYGLQPLFDGISLQMESGERLGLMGRNGHGKSTLFRIILGEEHPDSGEIVFPKQYRIGHLAQHIHFTQPTLIAEACLGLSPGHEGESYKAERILFGLGFEKGDLERAPTSFSGGYQIRINLAKVLVSEPNLLLLDEPTNYLDIVSIRWLVGFLKSWTGEMIVISHDRDFMDSVTTHTASIHRCQIKRVRGNIAKLENQIAVEEEVYEKTRVNEEKKRAEIQVFVDRFRAKATKAIAVQSRLKMLEKMPEQEELGEIASLSFSFTPAPFEAKTILNAEQLSFGYNPERKLLEDLSFNVANGDRIAIIGKNGKGKSTLLSLLAHELKPNSGEIKIHSLARTGYFGQTNINRLHANQTVETEIESANPLLDRTRVRGICGVMMFGGDLAEKKISCLSGGEKSRVLLGKILATPSNLLLLDEPTNHLDMPSIEALLASLENFPGAVVMVTHSEMILRRFAKKLIVFQKQGAQVYPGGYEDFLRQVGWQEEGASEQVSSEKKGVNKKEDRQRRAQWVAERAKALGPLKKKMQALENEIMQCEEEVKRLNEDLILSSQSGQAQEIVKLSQALAAAQRKIEENFDELSQLEVDYREKERLFENDEITS